MNFLSDDHDNDEKGNSIINKQGIDDIDNNIIILKKVKSIRLLRNHEKQWVRLCYKEAVLKGFIMMKDIQCYIASKTKIWIERSGIEYIKKSEEEEDKNWFRYLAKDHFAYVAAYKKAINEIELYMKEFWKMFPDKRTTQSEKIQIIKELHSLTKTYTMFLRDLPFVHNLTNYYDLGFYTSNKNDSLKNKNDDNDFAEELKKEIEVNSKRELTRQERYESGLYLHEFDPERGNDELTKPELFAKEVEPKESLNEDKGNNNDGVQINKRDKTITDELQEDMRRQMNGKTKPIEEMFKDKDFLNTMKNVRELKKDL